MLQIYHVKLISTKMPLEIYITNGGINYTSNFVFFSDNEKNIFLILQNNFQCLFDG